MKNKKYELILDDTITREGKTLHRIRALKDFEIITGKTITVGTLGGYIESEDNLSHLGCAWVGDNASVFGRATVFGNACVKNRAWVYGNACVDGNACVVGNARVSGKACIDGNAHVCGRAHIKSKQDIFVADSIGSRNDTTTFYKTADDGIGVTCGCFTGTIDEFAAAVEETHGDNKYGREYRAAIELAKLHILR